MDLDIFNFFPKYPNINNHKKGILNLYDDKFNKNITIKKEFQDLKLSNIEKFPENTGELMNHQKIIARFLSSNTPYKSLLLFHEMGTGKTCSSVAAIEEIKNENNSGFKGALVFASGDGLIRNYVNEIVFKCTDGRYIPDNYDKLTEMEKLRRINKSVSDYYTFGTFQTFAKEIKKSSNQELKNKYSNMIIVIDEIHNIRESDKKSNLDTYKQYHRFLHIIENCKIILMSGTPMKDSPEEISSVLNLILDMDNQFPIGQSFTDEYLNINKEVITMKKNKIQKFKNKCRGVISYLSSMKSDINKIFTGDKNFGKLNHFIVKTDKMNDFQTKYYLEASEKDDKDKGVYSNSTQAILFVYPDGSYGKKGFDKYMTKKPKRTIITKDGKRKILYKYVMKNELKTKIKGKDDRETLQKLRKFSSKYSEVIKNILDSYNTGKKSFVYLKYVKGSGSILFSNILKLFGFSEASHTSSGESKRFVLATGETSSTKQIKKTVNRFNKEDNFDGKIISLIIGSYVIAEGFTFKDIQTEEILTPYWNYSETAQVIARGWRLGSHNNLLDKGFSPNVNIFQRVSLPNKKSESSIDLKMYELSEIKDINIKHIERILKEISVDCNLFFNRNYVTQQDGNRDCEYTNCEYKCDDEIKVKDRDIDYSTYNLYYNKKDILYIEDTIKKLFRNKFSISINEIYEILKDKQNFIIMSTLRNIINKNLQIINKFGFISYLREQNDIFFLIDSLLVSSNDIQTLYYTENPIIKTQNNFKDILKNLEYDISSPQIKIVDNCCKSKNIKELRNYIYQLTLEAQIFFIESCILSKKLELKTNIIVRDGVLYIYQNYYKQIDDKFIIFLDNDNIRCLGNDNIWKKCDEKYIEKLNYIKNIQDEKIKNNKYGYYGLYNINNNEFCLAKVQNEKVNKDKRKRITGRRCKNWEKKKIIPIIINNIKLQIPNDIVFKVKKDQISKLSDKQVLDKINKKKYSDIINKVDKNELRRILFWIEQSVATICEYLKIWFLENKLTINDYNCGITKKVK